MTYHNGDQLVDPKFVFAKGHLQSAMHVADFGCGRTGHITIPAALAVGERGVVYAVDILKDVLLLVQKRASEAGLVNVHTIWSDVEKVGSSAIPANTLDLVFLVNMLSQTKQQLQVLTEAKRLLKDKSRMVIVDWKKNNLSIAPKLENQVNFQNIIEWGAQNNFVVQERFSVGGYHEGLVLYRHD